MNILNSPQITKLYYLLFPLPASILLCLFLYFSLTCHPFQFLIFLCVNCLIMWRAFLNQQNLLKQNKLYNTFYLIKKLLYNTGHGFEVSDMAATALQLPLRAVDQPQNLPRKLSSAFLLVCVNLYVYFKKLSKFR